MTHGQLTAANRIHHTMHVPRTALMSRTAGSMVREWAMVIVVMVVMVMAGTTPG